MGQYNIASLRETTQNYRGLWELFGPENVTYNCLEFGHEGGSGEAEREREQEQLCRRGSCLRLCRRRLLWGRETWEVKQKKRERCVREWMSEGVSRDCVSIVDVYAWETESCAKECYDIEEIHLELPNMLYGERTLSTRCRAVAVWRYAAAWRQISREHF